MNKNIYLISLLLIFFAIGAAFFFWPKGADQKNQIKTENSTSSQNVADQTADNNQDKKQQTMEVKLDSNVNDEITADKGPVMQIEKGADYVALLKTSEGDIRISLNATTTPVTVNNFIYLVRKGFYDNTIFHRIMKGFMIQGGDPTGTGAGGPGYRFYDEPFTGEYNRGTIAMARTMAPGTNGSQFFIMHKDYPLQPDYIIFGQVIEGIETVDKIAEAEVKLNANGTELSVPVNPVKILSAEVFQVKPVE